MSLLIWILAVAPFAEAPAPPCGGERMAAIVKEVMLADYRGDRAALDRLDVVLGELEGQTLGEYREYWRGFARWRRALNGFNETPTPADLSADLEEAIAHFSKVTRIPPELDRAANRDRRLRRFAPLFVRQR
jgi:hypothetical protein